MQILEGNHYGTGLSFCIIAARFNDSYVSKLLDGALQVLSQAGVEENDIRIIRVPGAFEIPLVAQTVAVNYDAIIALGCVIRGETEHFSSIVKSCSEGIMRVGLDTRTPIAHAILAVDCAADAQARCSGKINRGEEAARAALEMVNLMGQLGA